MFEASKSYAIGVWDLTFWVIDTDTGEPLTNEDGTVKLFGVDNYDYSYLADGIDLEHLRERKKHD